MGRPTPPALIAFLQRPVFVLVLLVVLLALPAIPTRELMPTDEPRFGLVARQMVEDPAPIVPHLGYDPITRAGETYGDKPPVFFWLVSLFSLLTGGVNEISARLPSFLAAIAAVLLTRRLGRLLTDERTGFAAAAILATSSQFFLRAGWCSIDMLLTALVLGATYCWFRAARAFADGSDGRVGAFRFAALGGLFAAAGTLSKGPVGLIFPVAFLAADRIAARWPKGDRQRVAAPATDSLGMMEHSAAASRANDVAADPQSGMEHPVAAATERASQRSSITTIRIARSLALRGVLLAAACYLLPILVWVLAIGLVGGTGYVQEILFRQNVTRYVAAWNNEQPWYYYLYRLPIGLFPWTILLPAAILAPRGAPDRASRSLRGLLLACGALFVFFSISAGKRGVYLLPLYPALAILLAAGWQGSASRPFRSIAAAHAGLLAALGIAAAVALPIVASRKLPELTLAAAILGLMLAAGTSLSAIYFFKGRADRSLRALVGGVVLLVFTASMLLVPSANRRSGLRDFGARLASETTKDDYLIVDREGYEQILFYSHVKGARRDFDRTRVSVESESVVLTNSRAIGEPDARSREATTAEALSSVTIPRDSTPSVMPPRDPTPAVAALPNEARLSEAERAARSVRFPAGARVVFVVRGRRADRLREAIGPTARVLFSAPLSDEPYFAIASR